MHNLGSYAPDAAPALAQPEEPQDEADDDDQADDIDDGIHEKIFRVD